MSDPPWLAVCEPEVATSLAGQDFSAHLDRQASSPIDDYYGYVEHLLTLGSADALRESATLGRLLLLGLVSGVESYFRSILAGVLRVCPVCRRCAADQPLPLGAIDYYGTDQMELGLFDTVSLAGATEIRRRTNKLLGIDLARGSSVDAALHEFDKLCHLRHAAVHARGTLGRGNALALSLVGQQALLLNLGGLHQAGAVCHSTVRAYNRFVYRCILERWIGDRVLHGVWREDKPSFEPLFNLFRSRTDGSAASNAYLAYRSLQQRAL